MLSAPRIPSALASRFAWAVILGGGIGWLAAVPGLGQDRPAVLTDQASAVVKLGERPLIRYQFAQNPAKPYVAELCSPAGVNLLRDSPIDHKHHHGLMFAVAVDGVDFWAESEGCGQQRHRGGQQPQLLTHEGQDWVVGTQQLDWVGPGAQKVLVHETRTIAVGLVAEAKATVLVWVSRLELPPGKDSATLSGSPYFGLGMRFVQSMDTGGAFQNADGKTGVQGTNNARSAWCAYTAQAGGKPVTVAMFDSPKNPRHPATWFTMDQPFAYMSATLGLSQQPLKLQSGERLVLGYAVAVWDGRVDKAQIDALYKRLLKWAGADAKP